MMFKKFVQGTLCSWIPSGKERVAMLVSHLCQVLFNICLVNEDVSKYTQMYSCYAELFALFILILTYISHGLTP